MTNVENMELLTYWLLALSTIFGWGFVMLRQKFYTKEQIDKKIESKTQAIKQTFKEFKAEYYIKQEEQEKLLTQLMVETKHIAKAIEKLEKTVLEVTKTNL